MPLAHHVQAAVADDLVITEIQSSQAAGSVNDYWELTNVGHSPIDLSNWKWNDSARVSTGAAVTIPPGTTIAAGESIIFTAITPSAFRTWWGLSNSVQVITTAAAPGLGQNDGVSLFTDAGAEVCFLSYAANGFTRSNGSGAAGGHAGASGGGSATAALVLDPAFGTAAASRRYTAATVGAIGAFASVANAADIGSPGSVYAGPKAIDLSLYVRVGRYNLPEPTRTTPPDNISLLAQEASGVTYNWDTDTLFVTADGGTSIVQVSKTGQLINSMTLAQGSSPQGTEFYDTEGITYVGNGQFVVCEERDRQLVLFTYAAGTTLTRAQTKTVKLGTFVGNVGIEGLSYDPLTSGFICVKEVDPQGVFQTTIDFNAGTASNGSPTTENSVNLFNPALANVLDLADVFALSNLPSLNGHSDAGDILLLSQESAKIVKIDRSGNIHSSLQIVSDPGNPLSVSAQQHEGLTMDRDGNLYVVNENGGGDFDHPQLWVYAPSSVPNQAPTAVALNNTVTSIPENSSTASAVKVADIIVTDDGLGMNNLSLSGADASFFEINGTALYIKAGTVLDFETKTSYSLTVNVDDTTVGNTPDATTTYTLTVTDVVNEGSSGPALIISEVAPWSSGNSPVGADWFEVSNISTNVVDITGWKVDDSSASFGAALALNGITSIAPGESVIFLETADLPTTKAIFLSTWFGTNPPPGLQIGSYTGSGIGLSTGGDAVNLYNSGGVLQASASFGAAPVGPAFPTFDNAVGLNGMAVSQLSVAGLYGAFAAVNDANEIGSPGTMGKLIISEVAPWSSSSPVGADWFEVSNTGARPVDITGWKVDDSSESPAAALALNGITTIAPGESVIFLETADLPTTKAAFLNIWFGANPPAGLQIGSYTGSGIGLSTSGDAVNLYDTGNRLRAKVTFGTAPAGPSLPTFDNAIGLNGVAITQLSATNRYGAFAAVNDANEIGSPGTTGKLVITEVAPWSSGNSPVAADWFEVSNTGTRAVNIAGWKVDDSSASFAAALALNGITNIAPGESVIFLETADLPTTKAAFLSTWFGTNVPTSLQVGSYTGSGIGLSTSGDAVNLYNSNGVLQASVTFGTAPASAPFGTFENAAGLNNVTLTQLSVAGIHEAFAAANDASEVGSPGNRVSFLGVASGDADANSAVLWTRINEARTVTLTAQVATNSSFTGTVLSFTGNVDPAKDYTVKVAANGLTSGTRYYYRFVVNGTGEASGAGTFKTAPAANAAVAVKFAFSGDMDGIMRPYALASTLPAQQLDFYVNLGDVIYENASAPAGNNGAAWLNSPSVTLSGDSATKNGVPVGGTTFATKQQLFDDYNKKYREQFLPVNIGGQNALKEFYAGQGNYTLYDNHELGNRQYINGGAPAGGSVGGASGTDMPTGRGVDARANGSGNVGNVNDINSSATDYMNRAQGFLTLQQVFFNYQPIRENRATGGVISAPSDPRTDGTKQLYFAQQWGKNALYVTVDDRTYRDIRLKSSNGAADDTAAPRANNPNRTMLGATQLAWLKQTLLDAQTAGTPWKFIAISDPIDQLGPIGGTLSGTLTAVNADGGKSWQGGYRAERNELLKFIADNHIRNVVFMATDDHQNRINELTYSPVGQTEDQSTYVKVPYCFSIVCGPLGATGPETITDHSFSNIKAIADSLANAQDNVGVEPLGLTGYPGLHNVVREGDTSAGNNPKAVDFYSPDTFNYTVLLVSADGQMLTVSSRGINSTAQNSASEYNSATNPAREIFSFQVDAANDLPMVSIDAPGQSAYVAPASIALQAVVSDIDGTISSVKFYAGDTLLATVTTPPYQFNWQNVPVGSYYVTARAEDNRGGVMSSTAQHIIVGPVGITAPTRTETGAFRFQLVGTISGKTHLIQVSTDFVNWTTIGTVTPGSNTLDVEDPDANGNTLRFYRVVQQNQ